jgi:hypothetical protein
MNQASIIAELERLRPRVQATLEAYRQHPRLSPEMDAGLEAHVVGDLTGSLAALLAAEPALVPSRQLLTGHTWIPLDPHRLATHAAIIAAETDAAAGAGWLKKMAGLRQARVRIIAEVLGVVPPEPSLQLGDMEILAYGALPATRTARIARRAFEWTDGVPIPTPPDVAMISTVELEAPQVGMEEIMRFMQPVETAYRRMFDTISILTGADPDARLVGVRGSGSRAAAVGLQLVDAAGDRAPAHETRADAGGAAVLRCSPGSGRRLRAAHQAGLQAPQPGAAPRRSRGTRDGALDLP